MQIQEIVGIDVNVKAIVACFLIHEGASTQIRNILGQTPLEGCTDPVLATVIATFAEQHAGSVLIYTLCGSIIIMAQLRNCYSDCYCSKGTYHGSLRDQCISIRPSAVDHAAPVAISKLR